MTCGDSGGEGMREEKVKLLAVEVELCGGEMG